MNFDDKALELIKAIDYDIWKECLETIKEEGGCMEVANVADFLEDAYWLGYDHRSANHG